MANVNPNTAVPLLKAVNLAKYYSVKVDFYEGKTVKALDGVSFELERGKR